MPQGIEPSNLGKVLWPEPGITKGELLEYMELVAPLLLHVLRDRPLTVKRYPDGVAGQAFFQKNTPAYAPGWVRTVTLRAESARRDVRYTVCNSRRTLLWLANQAALEFHPWLSRVDAIDRPDQMVFDFDPPEEGFDRAVAVALLMREALAEEGLEGAAKTSGSKGVHVYVPVQRRYTFEQVRTAALRLALRLEERAPELCTTDVALSRRAGRVFVDTNRNIPGQHTAAVYSPRARPEATVSFPVPWPDLGSVSPQDFTIRTVPPLVRRGSADGNGLRDPWGELMPAPRALPARLRRPAR